MLYFLLLGIDKEEIIISIKKNKISLDFINNYPERILPLTFFLLCVVGSIFLWFPISSNIHLSYLDSLFMTVSAVCVTGLSVLDVGTDLTPFGQFVLILLIQLGGLGIMSITSIVLILLGKRMSLSQEKTARSIFDVESKLEIKKSLFLIFKYTFLIEFIGALILSFAFTLTENNLLIGLKYGFFTSISAFCNAGFFLNSNSLMNYVSDPVILYTVSFLIIFGGISPAICYSVVSLKKGRKFPPITVLVFTVTAILLFGGTLFFLISEYNGVLSDLSFFDKVNNAWFQSASARTAGFNSLELSNINAATYLLMIILMVIGGSPGGTAGGVKTSTIGVLFLTFYNSILGNKNIIRNRQIKYSTVTKAITLFVAYNLAILVGIIILVLTQDGMPSTYIFEVVSAIGTVGLSQGVTTSLDFIGKIVIISLMFFGRVAPATLLCFLNTRKIDSKILYPDAKISLT